MFVVLSMHQLKCYKYNWPKLRLSGAVAAVSNVFGVRVNRWKFCLSMRESKNACVPRDVSRDKRGKFWKHLNRFKIKINNMNVENFAALFVLLAFIELSFTVASFIGEANNNKRKTRAFAQQENGKVL